MNLLYQHKKPQYAAALFLGQVKAVEQKFEKLTELADAIDHPKVPNGSDQIGIDFAPLRPLWGFMLLVLYPVRLFVLVSSFRRRSVTHNFVTHHLSRTLSHTCVALDDIPCAFTLICQTQ